MISTRSVQFSYPGSQIFHFPDIACENSDVLLIIGSSGVGKTTFLHLLGGILMPTFGEIKIGDTILNTLSNNKIDAFRGQNIGMVLQQNFFIESLTILDNLILASWLGKQKKDIKRIDDLLNKLGLNGLESKLPSQLSVGQLQRVSIVRALINEPKVILADEPTSSLDDENANNVADMLRKIADDFNTVMIIVTHDSRLKRKFANHIELD